MRRRLSLISIPLLAALLAGRLAAPRPAELCSAEAILRETGSSSTLGYGLPVARFQPALQPRTPLDRQSSPFWSFHPARPESKLPTLRSRASLPATRDSRPATYYFPLFPTGPPSHG